MDKIVLKQDVVSEILRGQFNLIYEKTNVDSVLRQLLVDLSAQTGYIDTWFTPDDPHGADDGCPQAFLMDLAVAQYNLKKGKAIEHDWDNLRCTFHVHPKKITGSRQEVPQQQQKELENEE